MYILELQLIILQKIKDKLKLQLNLPLILVLIAQIYSSFNPNLIFNLYSCYFLTCQSIISLTFKPNISEFVIHHLIEKYFN